MKTIKVQAALPEFPHRKRVAAYSRVSRDRDAMRHSLSAQVSYYNTLIQNRADWDFAGVYADDPMTGTNDARPEFQRMLTDCRAGKIDMVITKSVTRFARNTVLTLETVRELKLLGVDVYFEKENIHSISGDGELMLTILASYAQEESRSVSENIKWRIRNDFKRGKTHLANIMGYKPVNGQLVIMPEEAEIVRMIFADYLAGMGSHSIMKKLNASGISSKRNKVWSANTILKMLHNEIYKGSLLLQKTFTEDHITKKKSANKGELPMYSIEDAHEPIIDKDTFQRVQDEIARRASRFRNRKMPSKPYPFTGKIICGYCGKKYLRHAYGSKKAAWVCTALQKQGRHACASQRIPESALQKAVDMEFDKIHVSKPNTLLIVLPDGTEVERSWQHKGWSEAERQKAHKRAIEQWERRKNDANSKNN